VEALSWFIPKDVEAGQIRDVVKLYLEKHPELRHEIAPMLIRDALLEAFVPKE
jgi:hypothetical protein